MDRALVGCGTARHYGDDLEMSKLLVLHGSSGVLASRGKRVMFERIFTRLLFGREPRDFDALLACLPMIIRASAGSTPSTIDLQLELYAVGWSVSRGAWPARCTSSMRPAPDGCAGGYMAMRQFTGVAGRSGPHTGQPRRDVRACAATDLLRQEEISGPGDRWQILRGLSDQGAGHGGRGWVFGRAESCSLSTRPVGIINGYRSRGDSVLTFPFTRTFCV